MDVKESYAASRGARKDVSNALAGRTQETRGETLKTCRHEDSFKQQLDGI